MNTSPANPDGHQPRSDNRFAELCATLHELEQTHVRRDHPGITHLKWLIATHLAGMEGASPAPRKPRLERSAKKSA